MATASVDAIMEPNSAASCHFHPADCICGGSKGRHGSQNWQLRDARSRYFLFAVRHCIFRWSACCFKAAQLNEYISYDKQAAQTMLCFKKVKGVELT